ncbi:MAG: hypothetical protein ACREAA_20565 [Candidatus Polarisedimenticolia bacterium]
MKLQAWLLLCLLGALIASPSLDAAGNAPLDLQLQISGAKTSFSSTESILIDVTLRNGGTDLLYILSRMNSEGARGRIGPHPTSLVRFIVRGPDGAVSRYTGDPAYYDLVDYGYPTRCDLLILAPGSFHGHEVDLRKEPFTYEFPRPGKYTLRAEFETSLRDWFESLKNPRKEWTMPPTELPRVFNGKVLSNEIVIEVK